jgi:thiamine pyrophosphate-dependent acetolactate synthase large subunit-like protein
LNPDYKRLSDAFGIDYLEIQTAEELADGLREMEACKGVVLVDVKVEYDEPSKSQKGMAKASWQRLPFHSKLSLIGRRAGRMLTTRARENG